MSSNLITRSNFYRITKNLETLYRWSKLIDPDEETLWETRLMMEEIYFSIEKVVNRKRCRIDSFQPTREEAEALQKRHGGGVTEILPEHWEPTIDPENARILRIRDQLIVSETDHPETLAQLAAENPDRHILSFPPQLAFGTGGHPTTANCLRFIVDAAGRQGDEWTLLDLGCGSGILSIAAATLGATRSIAVELDPVALHYAEINGQRHEVSDRIDFVEADVLEMLKTPPDQPHDIVVANLFSDLLLQVLPLLKGWLKPGGDLIISGLLTTQVKAVNDQAKKCGFPLKSFLRRGNWVAAAGTCR